MFGFKFSSNLHWFCFVFCRLLLLFWSLLVSLSLSLCVFGMCAKIAPFNLLPPLCGVSLSLFLIFSIQSSMPKSFKRKISVVCKSGPKSLAKVIKNCSQTDRIPFLPRSVLGGGQFSPALHLPSLPYTCRLLFPLNQSRCFPSYLYVWVCVCYWGSNPGPCTC